jgi:hypothetical protein
MTEETRVGFVVWCRTTNDGDTLIRLGEGPSPEDGQTISLDPETYTLSRSHVAQRDFGGLVYASLLHQLRIGLTVDGGAVVGVSMATRPLPLETVEEGRRRVAEGPTVEAMDELARRQRELHEARMREAEARRRVAELEGRAGRPQQRVIRGPNPRPNE